MSLRGEDHERACTLTQTQTESILFRDHLCPLALETPCIVVLKLLHLTNTKTSPKQEERWNKSHAHVHAFVETTHTPRCEKHTELQDLSN